MLNVSSGSIHHLNCRPLNSPIAQGPASPLTPPGAPSSVVPRGGFRCRNASRPIRRTPEGYLRSNSSRSLALGILCIWLNACRQTRGWAEEKQLGNLFASGPRAPNTRVSKRTSALIGTSSCCLNCRNMCGLVYARDVRVMCKGVPQEGGPTGHRRVQSKPYCTAPRKSFAPNHASCQQLSINHSTHVVLG